MPFCLILAKLHGITQRNTLFYIFSIFRYLKGIKKEKDGETQATFTKIETDRAIRNPAFLNSATLN